MAPFKIAVEGCCHGSLNYIYTELESKCQSRKWTFDSLDLLIICGDFQAARNEQDLNCMSIPRKYRQLGDFHEYYSGAKRAPVLTLVIGGNHEASNYLSELKYGGWLAPNIYYLGAVGVIRFGPLRIAGMSGIYHHGDYHKPHRESLPYDRDELRSVYHVRHSDVSKLLSVRSSVDIGLSHDWPRRVEYYGDCKKLFAQKPHFLESAKIDNLGSEPAEKVLNHLRSRYWFSGHMHVKFSATIEHDDAGAQGDFFRNLNVPDALQKQLPRSVKRRNKHSDGPSNITNKTTHFLALDKPGSDRGFLESLEIESCWHATDPAVAPYLSKTSDGKSTLYYDEEWLAIVRATDTDNSSPDRSEEQWTWVKANVTAKGLLKVPENFEAHAPVYDGVSSIHGYRQPCTYPNSQTEVFCKMLGIGADKDDTAASDDDFIVFGH